MNWFNKVLSGASTVGQAKLRMIEKDLRGRGIKSAAVLEAVAAVPREEFVEDADRSKAYADSPQHIDCGQTISQPCPTS